MKILQLMDYPIDKIEKYISDGNLHQEHNLYGYILMKNKKIDVTWDSPNHNNKVLKFFQFNLGFGYNVMRLYPQISCLWKCKDYDIIYVPHDMHLLVLSIFRLIKICRKPIYVICHFSYNLNFVENKYKKFYKSIERYFVYKGIDKISFTNEKIMNLAISDYNVPLRHRNFVNWGANIDFFKISNEKSEDNNYFVSAGNANRDYNKLIEAFNGLNKELKIFSNKTEKDFETSIPNNVKFYNLFKYGLSGMSYLKDYYNGCIAILLPIMRSNDVPNGSTVLIEALAVGKPLIVSDFETNYIDVEKEGVGIKIKNNSIDEWKKAILFLIKNPDVVKEMGENAKKLAIEKYNYINFTNNVIINLKKIYQSEKK